MTQFRSGIAVGLALMVAVGHTGAAHAQDVPVVFIHGVFSNGNEWRNTAARLVNVLRIQPHVVDLNSTATLDTQTAQVHAAMGGLPNNTVAVGHSQGGLIARQWLRLRRLGGILTLGTPHAGAPLAQSGLDIVKHHDVAYNIAGLIFSFGSGHEFSWVVASLYAFLADTQILTANVVARLTSTVAVVNHVPVAPQLVPGSAFLNGLNGPTNLSRETTTGVRRASLVYTADQYWRAGVAVGLLPGYREWAWLVQISSPPWLEYAGAYVDANWGARNWAARTLAIQLFTLAAYIRDMDPLWCKAVTGDRSCQIPHDGIVPVTSQIYPGGSTFPVYGPAHTQEISRSDGPLANALKTAMGIQARGAPGTPPPPPPPSTGTDVLASGQSLRPDERIHSADGRYSMLYQTDGNLVVYGPSGPVWASDTAWASAGMVAMQGDGNLVIYDAGGDAVWSTDTFEPGSYARAHNDGGLQIVSAGGVEVWWSGSGGY